MFCYQAMEWKMDKQIELNRSEVVLYCCVQSPAPSPPPLLLTSKKQFSSIRPGVLIQQYKCLIIHINILQLQQEAALTRWRGNRAACSLKMDCNGRRWMKVKGAACAWNKRRGWGLPDTHTGSVSGCVDSPLMQPAWGLEHSLQTNKRWLLLQLVDTWRKTISAVACLSCVFPSLWVVLLPPTVQRPAG